MQVSQEIAPRATKDCLSVEGLSPQADKADISIRGSASSITAPQIASSPPCEKTTPPPTTFKNENKMIRLQLIPWSIVPMHKPILNELIERRFHDGDVFKIGRQVNREGVPPPLEPPGPLDVWLTSKVVSRLHAEMGMKDGAMFVRDLGSSSGTFLNKLRLSPTTKESKPYPVKEGDIIQFGVDYKGKPDDIYKSITVRIGFYDQSWVHTQRKKTNPQKFRTALISLLLSTNPHAEPMDEPETPECCICMEETGPFQALFFAPCSHCYHYKCVSSIIVQSAMFQCPLCRQVANLTASVSTENLNKITDDDEIVAIGAKGDFSAKKNENQERRPSNEDVIPAVATPHAVSAIKKKKSRASSFTSRITTFLVGKKAVAASSDNETPVSGAVSDVESPTSAPLSRNQSPLRQNIAGTNTPVSQEDLDRVDILAVQLNNNYVTVSSKANPAGIPRSTTATNFQGNNVPDEEQMRSRQSSGGAVL